MIVSDYAAELKAYLQKRKASYVDSLVKSPSDRQAGKIEGIQDALNCIDEIKQKFLTKDEDDE